MKRARFDENKAFASILYVAQQLVEKTSEKKADLYKTLKIIYFADKMHLARYCRGISGDYYIAMSHGPVPSKTYDLLKTVRGDGSCMSSRELVEKLKLQLYFSDRYTILPNGNPDLDELSESELECLNESIENHKNDSFAKLKSDSHDTAFQNSDKDDCMDFEKIARAGGADSEKLGFVRYWLENENLFAVQ